MATALDPYSNVQPSLNSAPTGAEAVTPSDTVPLTTVSKAIYVGGAGNLALVMADGSTVTLDAVPAGSYLPIRVSQVKATGTTATLLVAFV